MTATAPTPPWMRHVLLAAGAYNILWGALAVVFPHVMFDWLGMARPNYPQFWQCIGMIVGVYGIGYAIASTDPARHWPIVLVGLLGKVLGPLGMVQALWTGALPWAFALNCVFNDLIWWVPFALILRHAWRRHVEEPGGAAPPEEATLLAETHTSTGASLAELSMPRPVLAVFLRHSGCTFCREAMADLKAGRAAIEAAGAAIVLVHMSPPGDFAEFAKGYGLGDVPAVSDPERRLYRGLGLRRGRLAQLLGPGVWWRGYKVWRAGHGVGALVGDGTQMPGVFLIHRGRVVRRFMHATAADRPEYVGLCELPSRP
jgi:peroxiredoxin